MKSIAWIFLLFLLIFLASTGTAKVTREKNGNFNSFVLKEMKRQHIPAMSVLVFRKEKIISEVLLGKSNIKAGASLKRNDLFLLASVSKIVTATALMQLEEQGKLKLSDPINKHLSFNVEHPWYSEKITIKMLLTHISGIADSDFASNGNYYYGKDSPIALSKYLKDYFKTDGKHYDEEENFWDFKPGSKHKYSNMGSALIGVLVEEITGMDFAEYCKENIFKPLKMTNTAWHLKDINSTIVMPYALHNGEYEAIGHYTFPDYPNGGLRSTAADMFKFLAAFIQEGKSHGYRLLKKETINKMMKAQIPQIDETVGLHLFEIDWEEDLWGHSGGEMGVSTQVAFSPASEVGVIILASTEDADLDEIMWEGYYLGKNV